MAICLPELDKDITKREIAMAKLARTVLEEKGPEADFIRFALGVTYRQAGLGKGAMEGAFRLWVLDQVGVDLFPQDGSKLPTHADIALLNSIIADSKAKFIAARDYSEKLIKKYGSIEKAIDQIKDGDERIFTKFRRALPFTKRVNYYEKLIGGQVIYDKTLMIKTQHNAIRESFLNEIKDVLNSFESMIGDGTKKEIQTLSELSAEIAKLEQRQGVLEEMEANNDMTPKFNKELYGNNEKLEKLKNERDMKRYDYEMNPSTAILSKTIEIIEEKRPDFRDGIVARVAKEMQIKPETIKDAVEDVENYFSKFTEIGENTISNARNLVDMHLERLGFTEAEREPIIERLTFKPIEKGYFPRIEVLTKDAVFMQSIVNILSERSMKNKEGTESHITRLVSDFMKHREAEAPTGERNFNLIDVMIKYSEQMLHTNYMTKISNALETHTMALRDIARKGGNDALDVYLEGYRREVETLRADAIGTTDHGIASHLSRASLAMQVAARLGMLNFGGQARNIAEGTIMTGAVSGYKMIMNALSIRGSSEIKSTLESYTAGQQINLSVEQFWHPEKGFASDHATLVEMLGKDLARYVTGARLENANWAERAAELMAKGSGEAAQKLLKMGWSQVENKARANAHKVGQVTGLTIAKETYKPYFVHGRVSEAMIKRFGLNKENALSNDKDIRLKEYEKLEKIMVNNTGFEAMAGTQWIYDAQERHYIEGWTPGGVQAGKHIALFQHYPLSWNTAMYLAGSRTFARMKAGGFKTGLTGTTKESRWAMFGKTGFNRDAVYLMSMAFWITAGMLAEKEWAMTRKLGFRVYGMFSNPAIDVIEGLGRVAVGAATGDKELRDRAMFGKGVLNQVTGPPISDFMNVANIAAVEYGIDSEDWPDWLQALSRHSIGYTPNPNDANWDTQNKVESAVEMLRKTTPFTNKGLPIILHQTSDTQGGRSPFVTDLLRYILNITPVYSKKPAQDQTPEEAERVRLEKEKDIKSERAYGQETRRQ